MKKFTKSVMIGLLTLSLSSCAGWTDEDDANFAKACNPQGESNLIKPCECTLKTVKAQFESASDFANLSEKEKEDKIYDAAEKGNCVSWESSFVKDNFLGACTKGNSLGTKELTTKFCDCALGQAKDKYKNTMKFVKQFEKMGGAEGEKVFKELGMPCFSWDIVEHMLSSNIKDENMGEDTMSCVVDNLKENFESASEFINKSSEDDKDAQKKLMSAMTGCMKK